MKQLLALLLALLMIFALVACDESNTPGNTDTPGASQDGDSGDKNTGGEESGSGTEVKDITPENWDKVISANFGLDLTLPNGWSVAQAKSPNGVNNATVFFTVGGDATYATFGETVFAQLKAGTTGDVYQYGSSDNLYATFEDANAGGVVSMAAKVNDGKKTLVVNYFDNGTTVELSLLLF